MQKPEKKLTLKEFVYRLWFTRDDDLDALQFLFTIIVIVTLLVTWRVVADTGIGEAVKIEGLVTLRWLTGLLVITAVPRWMVPFISTHTKSLSDKKLSEQPEELT